jgi:hypothetical protein
MFEKPLERRIPKKEENTMENRFSISELEKHDHISLIAQQEFLVVQELISETREFFHGERVSGSSAVLEFIDPNDRFSHLRSHNNIPLGEETWTYPGEDIYSTYSPGVSSPEALAAFNSKYGAKSRSFAAVKFKSDDGFSVTELDKLIDPRRRHISPQEFYTIMAEELLNGVTLGHLDDEDGKGRFAALLMRPDKVECMAVALINKKGRSHFRVMQLTIDEDVDFIEEYFKKSNARLILPVDG